MRIRLSALTLLSALCVAWCARAEKPMTMETPFTRSVSRELPLPEYPRPQFERESWVNLNGKWNYTVESCDFEAVPGPHRGRKLDDTPHSDRLDGRDSGPLLDRRASFGRETHPPPAGGAVVRTPVRRAARLEGQTRRAAFPGLGLGDERLRERQAHRAAPRRLRPVLVRHHGLRPQIGQRAQRVRLGRHRTAGAGHRQADHARAQAGFPLPAHGRHLADRMARRRSPESHRAGQDHPAVRRRGGEGGVRQTRRTTCIRRDPGQRPCRGQGRNDGRHRRHPAARIQTLVARQPPPVRPRNEADRGRQNAGQGEELLRHAEDRGPGPTTPGSRWSTSTAGRFSSTDPSTRATGPTACSPLRATRRPHSTSNTSSRSAPT